MSNFRRIGFAFAALFLAGAIPSSAGTLIDVAFTGGPATTKTGFAATGVTSNDFWNTCAASFGSGPLEYVDGTASGAGLTISQVQGAATNGASDAMYGTYVFNTNLTVTITNLLAGIYDFYVYGHGSQDDQGGVFWLEAGTYSSGIEATTNGGGWLSPVWQEGVQYVEFTEELVLPGQAVTFMVEPSGNPEAVLSGLQMAYLGPLPPVAPFFVSQPAGQEITAGATAIFGVVAGGTPPLAYQWLFDNTIISAATNSNYTVTNGGPANAGNYSVVVTNAYGNVTSDVAVLTVITLPVIVSQPTNQSLIAGQSANFGVLANGPPPLTYQWLLNNTNIPTATNSSYTVTNAGPANAGNYSVIVTNTYGSVTSDIVVLTVVPVLVLSQPANQIVIAGQSAAFAVLAAGAPPLAYQWFLNSNGISGATNSSYIATNAQPANAGIYTVIVSNVYGSVTSQPAALNVVPAGTPMLIDVAFNESGATGKTGPAATGQTTNDFWNTCSISSNSFAFLTNLKFSDGAASGAGITVSNAGGWFSNSVSDPMYANFLYGNVLTVTLTNLSPGVYDFYLYGHGNENAQNSVFQLAGTLQSFGAEATTTNSDWLSPLWQEGVQYVEFTNAIVASGRTVTITVGPGAWGISVLCGLQMAMLSLPTNGAPLLLNPGGQLVNVPQQVEVPVVGFGSNGPISFTLAPDAPAGAIFTNGVFRWTPACEQGSSTNLITLLAADGGNPPWNGLLAFSVIVGPCVEVNIGSGVAQAGQSACLPVNLVSSVGLTNLGFTLAFPGGFLTNWAITATNSLVASATAQTVDSSNVLFNVSVQSGQALLGSNVIGSICVDALPGVSFASAPLAVADMGTAAADGVTITNVLGQVASVSVVEPQPLLQAWLAGSSPASGPVLTLYGTPGQSYDLLTTTNLFDQSSWTSVASLTLTNFFQVINLGALGQMQFFNAVQSQTNIYSQTVVGYVNVTLYPGFNMVADPLQSSNNTICSLLNDASGYYDKMIVFKWTGTGFQADTPNGISIYPCNWDVGGVITMNPGEAAWIKNPNTTNMIVTFAGTVPQGTLTNTIAGPSAFTMLSSQVPQAGDLATNLGFTNFNQGDTIFVFNPTNYSYTVFNYNTNTGNSGWLGNFIGNTGDPILQVGQGFWYKTSATAPATTTWIRTFSVNQ